MSIFLLLWLCSEALYSLDTELHFHIFNAKEAFPPIIQNDMLLLSYKPHLATHVVSLAFEHENYQKLHTYKRNSHGVFVLMISLPEELRTLRYRLVVDGLWIADPLVLSEKDDYGISISRLDVPFIAGSLLPGAKQLSDGRIQFVYWDKPGAQVSLVGDFNRWDPYLTPMMESEAYPGMYSIALHIPLNFRLYRFIVDGQEILDPVNKIMLKNAWGELASLVPNR